MAASQLVFLVRLGWTLDVPEETRIAILVFLSKCGWEPSVPDVVFLSDGHIVSESEAASLAAAGQIVNDPLAAHSAIRFDMGKLAEIVAFASEGGFTIGWPNKS
jgi:hypothetical protein